MGYIVQWSVVYGRERGREGGREDKEVISGRGGRASKHTAQIYTALPMTAFSWLKIPTLATNAG